MEKPGTNGSKAGLDIQEQAYAPGIRFAHQTRVGQVPFLLGCFFGQDVAFERVLAFDFTSPGDFEPLFSCGIGFYFWHVSNGLNKVRVAFRHAAWQLLDGMAKMAAKLGKLPCKS